MHEEARELEALIEPVRGALERQVYYRISNRSDAEDVLQEVLIQAERMLPALRDRGRFKPWILTIARNRVRDYYRQSGREAACDRHEIVRQMYPGKDRALAEAVHETLRALDAADRLLLDRFYLEGCGHAELSKQLGIPVGTVKSRLFAARERFRKNYPYPMRGGREYMSILPEFAPEIEVVRMNDKPFETVCEQEFGSFIVPRLGERAAYATYDYDDNGGKRMRKTSETTLEVVGPARVHGLDCVEVREEEKGENEGGYTAFSRVEGDRVQTLGVLMGGPVRRIETFLDDDFQKNWGFGLDNAGEETLKKPRGAIIEESPARLMTTIRQAHIEDVAGRYTVRIGRREFDAIRLIYMTEEGTLCENFVTGRGRSIFFRRFNRDDWRSEKPGFVRWTERFPQAERLWVDENEYVLWYICIPQEGM